MQLKDFKNLTLKIRKDRHSNWYCSSIKELPGAISQGKTIKSAINNVIDAANLMLDVKNEKSR